MRVFLAVLLCLPWLVSAEGVDKTFSFADCHRVQGKVVCDPREKSTARPVQKNNLQALVNVTPSGGTLTIAPGEYQQGLILYRPITLNMRGVHMHKVVWKKAALIVEQTEPGPIVINDYQHDGRHSDAVYRNLSGLRISGKQFDVTLNNAHIQHTAMGVLTDNKGGSLTINDSVIENIGGIPGQSSLSHIVYAGLIDTLTIQDTVLRNSTGKGHLLKSRAKRTTVSRSELAGKDGEHSRVIDISCGGFLAVTNSLLQASANADNADLIAMGVEAPQNCHNTSRDNKVVITGNTILFDIRHKQQLPLADQIFFNWQGPVSSLNVSDNIIVAPGRFLWQAPWRHVDISIPKSANNCIYKTREAAGLAGF
ncbi:MAG: hypothetical protein CSA53_01045 [Gammaproteobacteria bacterium]|nr:MAG: hypothetical protein CSA53_01045 [Gammaproteobacteria bacterium]